jgi:hypothetical protein
MINKKLIINKNGFDLRINNCWYGIHWFWQEYPLFGIVNIHRKCNTIHEYGIVLFGFNLYYKIDK